jgi:hypothetical protein
MWEQVKENRLSLSVPEDYLQFSGIWVHPRLFGGSVLLIALVFCVVLFCVFTIWIPCCDVRYDFRVKTMFGLVLPPVVCRRAYCLIYVICACLRIMLSNTCCVVFLCWFSSSCVPYVASLFWFSSSCVSHVASLFWLPLRYSLTFIYISLTLQPMNIHRHKHAWSELEF